MTRIILYAAVLEAAYLTLSFGLAQHYGQWSYEGEMIRTGLRVISIIIYSYYYKRYFYSGQQSFNPKATLTPQFVAAVSLLLVFAIIYTNAEKETILWQIVFAVSGMIAGLREELFYRGIIQNTLQKNYSYKIALVTTTVIFVSSHIQYIYYGQLYGLLFIACAGIIFGSIFIMTGSVALTAGIHGLYDALLSINVIPFRISNGIALPLLCLIMMVFLVINKKLFRPEK